MDNKTFAERRREYIGGSDAGAIYGVSEWGCKLSVFNQKSGIQPDYDSSDKAVFRRGHRLEETAAKYYEEKTGRTTKTTETVFAFGKPYLAVNIDRLVYDKEKEGPGYLEIKTVGRETFYRIKRDGMTEAYIAQINYGCAVAGLTWGAFAVYWPDGDELLYWDIEASPVLGEKLLAAAEEFWLSNVELGIPPERLEYGSKPCKTCDFRKTCWSAKEFVPNDVSVRDDLEETARQYREIAQKRKDLEKIEDDLKTVLIGSIGNKEGVYKMGDIVGEFRVTKRQIFDQTEFSKNHPDLKKQFTKTSESKSFKIKENGNDD